MTCRASTCSTQLDTRTVFSYSFPGRRTACSRITTIDVCTEHCQPRRDRNTARSSARGLTSRDTVVQQWRPIKAASTPRNRMAGRRRQRSSARKTADFRKNAPSAISQSTEWPVPSPGRLRQWFERGGRCAEHFSLRPRILPLRIEARPAEGEVWTRSGRSRPTADTWTLRSRSSAGTVPNPAIAASVARPAPTMTTRALVEGE